MDFLIAFSHLLANSLSSDVSDFPIRAIVLPRSACACLCACGSSVVCVSIICCCSSASCDRVLLNFTVDTGRHAEKWFYRNRRIYSVWMETYFSGVALLNWMLLCDTIKNGKILNIHFHRFHAKMENLSL